MELLQLKYFLEVASSQHMTRSAEKLHIAQPSLSQSIRRLEEELGVELFSRKGRNIVLTPCGVELRTKLAPLLEKLDALPEQLRGSADPEKTTIRLHVAAASVLVSEAIVAYRRLHHQIKFQFLFQDDEEICDISIASRLFRQHDDDGSSYVCDEKIYLAVPDIPEYSGLNQVNLVDFRDCDFIGMLNFQQFRRICDRFCARAGFTPRTVFESDNAYTVRNMIAANMGVGFWPAFSWGRLECDNVRLLEIAYPICARSIVVTMNRARVDNSVVEDFFRFLTREIAQRIPQSIR